MTRPTNTGPTSSRSWIKFANVSKQSGHSFDFKLRGCSPQIIKALSALNSEWTLDVIKPVYSYWWNPEVVVIAKGRRPSHLRANRRAFSGQLRAFLDQLAPLMAVSEVTRLLSRSPSDRNPLQLDREQQERFLRLTTDSVNFQARIRGDTAASYQSVEASIAQAYDSPFDADD